MCPRLLILFFIYTIAIYCGYFFNLKVRIWYSICLIVIAFIFLIISLCNKKFQEWWMEDIFKRKK
jgi:hypothetical protein